MAYRILQTSVLLILAILTTGCASQLKVTYKSDPSFASIYVGDMNRGRTPVTLYYDITEEHKKHGSLRLEGASARWVSGAFVELKSINADLKNGLSQELTFQRPDNYPGREKDEAFVLEYLKILLMLRQAQAQEDLVAIQRNKEFSNALKEIEKIGKRDTVIQPTRRPINCTSSVIGGRVITTCD